MSVIDFNSLVNFGQNAFAETFEGLANAHRTNRFLTTVGKNGRILRSGWQNVTTNCRYAHGEGVMRKRKQQFVRRDLRGSQWHRRRISLCVAGDYEGSFYCNSRRQSLHYCYCRQDCEDACGVWTLPRITSDHRERR